MPPEPHDSDRLINLNEEWKTGLTGVSAAILFAIVHFRRHLNRRVRLDEIVSALERKDPGAPAPAKDLPIDAGIRFKSGSIETTAPKLRRVRWLLEKKAYVDSNSKGYQPIMDSQDPLSASFITDPLTAKLLLSIYHSPVVPVGREEFITWAGTAYHWDSQQNTPEDHLRYLVEHWYCKEDNGLVSVPISDDGRFEMERGYLELLVGPEGYKKYAPAPPPQSRAEEARSFVSRHGSLEESQSKARRVWTIIEPLTNEQAILLFHITRLQLPRNWAGVSLDELVSKDGSGNLDGNPNNILKPELIESLTYELQGIRWEKATGPYLRSQNTREGHNGVGTTSDTLVTLPRTAAVLLGLADFHDPLPDPTHVGQIQFDRCKQHLCESLHLDPNVVQDDLDYMMRSDIDYIMRFTFDKRFLRITNRLNFERRYISRLAELFPASTARTADDTERHEDATAAVLSSAQAAILMALWRLYDKKGGLPSSPLEISNELNSSGVNVAEGIIRDHLCYLQTSWRWRIIESDSHGGYKLAWGSALSHPNTAFMLVTFDKIPRTKRGRVREVDLVTYLKSFGIDEKDIRDSIKFCLAAEFLKSWENETNYFLTERVEYERPYLQLVADTEFPHPDDLPQL